MILGTGTDLVHVPRIRRLWERHGQRFARRILAESEQQRLVDHKDPVQYLAKRFAAKEACAKALGCGFRDGLTLPQIAVANDELGRPYLLLSGVAAERLTALQGQLFLSLADDGDYAQAFVILSRAG